MRLLNKLKLNLYPDLKSLNLSSQLLEQIMSNKSFKSQYMTDIKPFIKFLREYRFYDFVSNKEVGLEDETLKQHLKAVFELSITNNSAKYIAFIKQNSLEQEKINSPIIFNDSNFEKLYSIIGENVFNDNICEIINNGNSERLLQFIGTNTKIDLNNLVPAMFEQKVWDVISTKQSIGDTTIFQLFNANKSLLIDIINKDLFDGLLYTYENIPESHNFIKEQLCFRKEGSISLQQFSGDFIENIGIETLRQLYARHKFSDQNEFKKIFEIYSFKNYELIQDIVNYDTDNFNFKNISSNDMQKKLIETNINYYNKGELFLNKYLGIERNDIRYIKLFLDSINQIANLPSAFKDKYESLLKLLNQIFAASEEELISISKSMDLEKKEDYKKLIESCEKEGNDVLKRQFVEDLKIKNQQIIETTQKKEIESENGKKLTIYELSGQPFTMLVHAVVDNRMSVNNSYVEQIINSPENWNNINGGNNHISTSLISDKYMVTYGTPNNNNTVMFGFNSFHWNSLKFTELSDVGIDRNASTNINYNMRNRSFISNVNTITTVDNLMKKTIETNLIKHPNGRLWNEIGLSRIDESTGMKIKPDFIVCMDKISQSSIRAAEHFNVPIYLINRKNYSQLPYINISDDLQVNNAIETEEDLKR